MRHSASSLAFLRGSPPQTADNAIKADRPVLLPGTDKANAQRDKSNAQRDEMFKGYLAMIRNGVVKEEDVLTLMSDNTKNEFLKWIESNGNG